MISQTRKAVIVLMVCLSVYTHASEKGLTGRWELVPQNSDRIALYNNLSINITEENGKFRIIHTWGRGRSFTDVFEFETGGTVNSVPVRDRVWPTNVFMGISMDPESFRSVTAATEEKGHTLRLNISYEVLASQGRKEVAAVHT